MARGPRRYSFNELKSFEAGTTSNWYVFFNRLPQGSSKAPAPSNFNLINNSYCPVSDVSYPDTRLVYDSFEIGPGLELKIPTYFHQPDVLSLTVIDDHNQTIRKTINSWSESFLKVKNGLSPTWNDLKDYCLEVNIKWFNKTQDFNRTDVFYVLPPENTTASGDQSFGVDNLPLELVIVGNRK